MSISCFVAPPASLMRPSSSFPASHSFAESGFYQGFMDAHLTLFRGHLGLDAIFFSIFTEDEVALPSRNQNPYSNFLRYIKTVPSPGLPTLLRIMGPRAHDDNLNCALDWYLEHQAVDIPTQPGSSTPPSDAPATLTRPLQDFFTELHDSIKIWRGDGDSANHVTPGWRFLKRRPDDPDWAMCCLPAMPGTDRKRHVLYVRRACETKYKRKHGSRLASKTAPLESASIWPPHLSPFSPPLFPFRPPAASPKRATGKNANRTGLRASQFASRFCFRSHRAHHGPPLSKC